MSALRELLVSGLTPVAIILATIVYKALSLPDPPLEGQRYAPENGYDEGYEVRVRAAWDELPLAVIELLVSALAVVVVMAATTSNTQQRSVSIATIACLVVVMPLIAMSLKHRRRRKGCRLSRTDLWTYNGLGFIVFFVSYFVSHYSAVVTLRSF